MKKQSMKTKKLKRNSLISQVIKTKKDLLKALGKISKKKSKLDLPSQNLLSKNHL